MADVTGWWAEVSTAVTAPRMAATALLKAPTVSSVSPFLIAPARMSATATMPTPALGLSTTITVPRMAATGAMPVPVVANFLNAAVTVPRMAATAAMAAPSVSVSYAVTVPRMAATGALAVPVVATINGASYSDTFNRANSSTLGASWNTDASRGTSITISSNAAVNTATSGNIYATPMATGDNQITLVMKGTPASGDFVFITARSDSATTTSTATTTKQINVSMRQGFQWTLYGYQADSGVSTVGNQSWADGDTIVFTCVGGTLTLKQNGTTILTTGGATDLSAGYVGLKLFNFSGTSYGFDSFAAQDI